VQQASGIEIDAAGLLMIPRRESSTGTIELMKKDAVVDNAATGT
jgi:hypothetical protein